MNNSTDNDCLSTCKAKCTAPAPKKKVPWWEKETDGNEMTKEIYFEAKKTNPTNKGNMLNRHEQLHRYGRLEIEGRSGREITRIKENIDSIKKRDKDDKVSTAIQDKLDKFKKDIDEAWDLSFKPNELREKGIREFGSI